MRKILQLFLIFYVIFTKLCLCANNQVIIGNNTIHWNNQDYKWIYNNKDLTTKDLFRLLENAQLNTVLPTIIKILDIQGNKDSVINDLATHTVNQGHLCFIPIYSNDNIKLYKENNQSILYSNKRIFSYNTKRSMFEIDGDTSTKHFLYIQHFQKILNNNKNDNKLTIYLLQILTTC